MSNKIVITIPSVNVPEVEYTFHCLLSEFLGLQYDIIVSEKVCDYSITYDFQTLQIANHFFRDDNLTNLYRVDNIPSEVSLLDVDFEEATMPQVTLFGKPNLTSIEDGYRWENDVIASTFYMLTRWEETVVLNRDRHNRFLAKDSLALKRNFLHRPIVNEYVEVIYQVLRSFGIEQKRKYTEYRTVATHDIDRPYLWGTKLGKIKSIGASLLLRRSKEEIKSRARNVATGTDPFDTFEMLMDKAESIGQKAHFFFMAGGDTQFDGFYDLADDVVVRLIDNIKERKHLIGIHPSYNSYLSREILTSEIDKLESATGTEIVFSRQHFLRFDVSCTWSNLDSEDLNWDSTMCYADVAGFRCGVCYTYPVYDINLRKQLALLERPLIVMDTTLLLYEELGVKQALSRVENLQKEVDRYSGDFVFLWHNSSFNSHEWIEYEEVFNSMYKQY